jgi:hydroxyacylglutathione hydrolase
VGDALFALGCGRMFEGTAPQFWASLQRLKALPAQTTLYCAHEYTAANARFALHADPDNAGAGRLCRQVEAERAENRPTVPFPLARELATNPSLRADDPAIRPAGAPMRWPPLPHCARPRTGSEHKIHIVAARHA